MRTLVSTILILILSFCSFAEHRIRKENAMLNNSKSTTFVASFESLSIGQKAELTSFIRGAIQGALSEKETFAVSDIVGGKFTNWEGTPLQWIYEFHKNKGECLSPENEAGKDMGRIFKNVMSTDSRNFEIKGSVQRRFKSNLYGLA